MEYNERTNKKNITYLMIGVLTLILAVSGATYAYFTATDNNTDVITGDMATINFDVAVTKVTSVDNTRGLIPMSNSMVEAALTKNAEVEGKGVCVDDNNNAVCQVYKITTTNESSASMFIDGYVTLTGGSGEPTDYPSEYYSTTQNEDGTTTTTVNTNVVKNKTTMRWAQVFCDESDGVVSNCTTEGTTTTDASKSDNGVANGITTNWGKIENTGTEADSGYNKTQILTSGISTKAMVLGSEYDVINTNYIRISNHNSTLGYTRTNDITSALVYSEFLSAKDATTNPTGGSSETYTDSQVFYIVVWLSETGTNQTVTDEAKRVNFFTGTVKFISAQGSEVTATFSDYSAVSPDTLTQ